MKKIYLFLSFALLFLTTSAQTVYEWYQDGVLIFQLDTDSKFTIRSKGYEVNLEEVSFLQDMIAEYGIESISRILYYHPDPKLNHTYQINFSKIDLIDQFVKDIDKFSFVEYAEKKELHVKFLTPNDLGANSTTGTGMWHLYKMQAQQAWDLSTGSASVIVAVTDDAIKTTHPDLAGKFVAGNDASDQNSTDPNPCGGNDGNHGTHVAGTVGASTNNGTGVASIGYNVSIMPVKIGRCSDGALTAGYEGLAWAANNGADVINMSWGGGGSSTFGQNVCNTAFNQGAILVAAAGNDGTTSELYPAAYNNVIAVASTTTTDARSSFSQYGNWIDIAAPGSAIRSTVASGNTYDRYDGTSMASPNTSGLLGLMKSYASSASNTDLINCLYSSADPVTTNTSQMGAGRINAFAALQCLTPFILQTDASITEISSPENIVCGSSFTPEITLRNFGSNTVNNVTINYSWGTVNANFPWSGTLTSGQSVVIQLPVQNTATGGNFTFTASVNLSGDQNASNNSQSQQFLIDPNGQVTNLTLVTDCYGSETTWDITDNQNNVLITGGPYGDVTGGETINESFCLPIGCYTFNIYDSYGDGMYGSQWNSCSVNGDYNITASNGGNLVQMTAANADFGNGTSHNFCVINPNINDDAGISEIVFPQSIICDATFAPQVRLRNFGNNNLNSVTIVYNVGGANQSFNWTGNLSTGQTQVVTLPNITSAGGTVLLSANTTNPNGNSDQNTSNDQSQASFNVLSSSQNLPFTESFNSNSISSGTWSVSNPDNAETWELVAVSGTSPGTTGARMNFFNYAQSSQRDGLISPKINLNGYLSATMSFEHAYRRFDQSTTDSLVIYVSTNCGSSWTRVFQAGEDATGSFATASTNTNAFVPANAGEWCMGTVGSDCFDVDLTAYVGNEVLIMFEGFNSGTIGNNLYLDNINITGVTAPLSANFTASSQAICAGESITFSDNSTGTFTSQSWSFPGGSPNSAITSSPTITYNTPGTYNVSYTITGPNGSDTELKNNFITVNASPSVSITGNSSVCLNGSTFLTANATPGSGSISTYQWYLNGTPIGSNSNTLNATSAGSYTVEVSNSTNCTATSNSFNLGLAALPTVTLTGGGAYCAGDFTTLTAVASTPSGTISNYEWYNGGSAVANGPNNTYNANTSGTYSVIVSNSAGCTAQSNPVNVAAPTNSPSVSISGNTTICPNGTTTLTGSVAAGSGSIISYEWFRNGVSIGNNSANLFTSQGGVYELRAINSAGCSGTSSPVTVNLETPFTIDFITNDASCGSSNGSASASVNGSTNGYSFVWATSPALNSPNINNLAAGIYQVEVTNNTTGCTANASVQINNIGAPVIDSSYVIQSTCDNGNVGAAGVFVSGGTGTYTYNWGTGLPNASSVNNLSPGNYVLNVVDQAQCLVSFGFTIINAVAPTIDTAIVSDATCSGVNNGTIDLVLSGGSGSYSYQWSTGEISQDISNLSAGSYTLTLTDNLTNCEATSTYTIENSYTLSNNFVIVDNSASQGNSSITASAAGGVSPYTYSWNNGSLSGAFIDSLSGGEYVLTVQDANNCLLLDTASIGFVGIAEQSPIESLLLYPNPTSDVLQLDLELEEKATVNLSIINSLGQQIWSSKVDGFENGKIDLPSQSLSAGTYYVHIQIDNSMKFVRFVKVN